MVNSYCRSTDSIFAFTSTSAKEGHDEKRQETPTGDSSEACRWKWDGLRRWSPKEDPRLKVTTMDPKMKVPRPIWCPRTVLVWSTSTGQNWPPLQNWPPPVWLRVHFMVSLLNDSQGITTERWSEVVIPVRYISSDATKFTVSNTITPNGWVRFD